jgi:hypothetical protein
MPILFKRISSFWVNPGSLSGGYFCWSEEKCLRRGARKRAASSSIAQRIGYGDGGSNLTVRDEMLSSTGRGFAKLTTYEPFLNMSLGILVLFIVSARRQLQVFRQAAVAAVIPEAAPRMFATRFNA